MTRSQRLAAVFAIFLATISNTARAQRYVPAATFNVASGMQGGGGKEVSLLRAPTRFRLGAELHVDEDPTNGLGFAALLDLEPRARIGADLRYVRTFSRSFAITAGAIGYITPGTMIGPTASLEVRHPIGKSLWLTAGPEVNVFVVGIDIPDKTVIWQTLLHLGLRVDL
jgi:hypothetical protein